VLWPPTAKCWQDAKFKSPIDNFILTVWWANYAGKWVWTQMGADLTQQMVIAVAPLVLLTAVVVAVIAGFLTLAADNRGDAIIALFRTMLTPAWRCAAEWAISDIARTGGPVRGAGDDRMIRSRFPFAPTTRQPN
jgi:hypothetical protein